MICYAHSMEKLRSLGTVWREPKPGAQEIWGEYLRLRTQLRKMIDKLKLPCSHGINRCQLNIHQRP